MVTVYRYRVYDPVTGEWVVELSKATADHIKAVQGQFIEATAEQVDEAAIDAKGRYVPR
jgi:hypothetical protein